MKKRGNHKVSNGVGNHYHRADRLFALSLALILLTTILSSNIGMSGAVSPTTNISNTSGESIDPVIATSGSNVYVAWVDDSSGNNDIVFTMSDDGGETFGSQITFDDGGGISTTPRIAASESNVHLAWTVTDEIFFSSSNNSGSTFSDPVNLSSNPTSSTNPRVAASGPSVHVAWVDGSSTSADIMLVVSNDAGDTFSDQITLVDTGGSSDPQVAASGSNVYLAWRVNNEIYFTASDDAGSTFSDPVNLSSTAGGSLEPAITASGHNVHVAWADATAGSIGVLVASSTDSGATFDAPPALLNVDDLSGRVPSISISAAGVHVAWQVRVDPDNEVTDIFFSSSNNSGSTFSDPVNLSSNAGSSIQAVVASSSSGVYVAWRDDFIDPTNNEILSTFSSDGGQNFVSPINLSNSPADTSKPGLAVSTGGNEDAVVVMFEVPGESTPFEIFLQRDIDFSETGVSIDSVSNSAPRWDIDTVSASGTLSNSAAGDTITVDWGDGNLSTGIPVAGSAWGPVDHLYASDAIPDNPIGIIAHLVDSSNVTKASSSAIAINVQPHSSLLELDPIAAIPPGSNVTISGTLTDDDASSPIAGELVTLNGTGVDSLSLVSGLVTDSDGSFSVTGPSVNSTADDWTVQAHFAGSQKYDASDSDLATYATLSLDAVEYEVPSGQNSTFDLTNLSFNASITFENVLEDGSIFVSECSAPENERYDAAGSCAEISSALVLAEDSDFAVSISHEGLGFGGTFIFNEIDIFHEAALGGITDITQSRDLDSLTVTGVAADFGRFFLGDAIHAAEPEGAFRQQLYISEEPDNVITFRNITDSNNSTAQVSLDKESYKVGETATLTVIDPEGNADPSKIDITTAGIKSDTSGSEGITIILHETTESSGVFQGTFTLVSGSSTGNSLQAQSGDKLSVAYNIPARARVVIDGIRESGLLQITDYLVPQEADFVPFGGAIKAELIDAQLSEGSRVKVTLSYANARIGGNDPNNLRLVQEVEDGVWIDITDRDFQGEITGVDIDAKTITGETGTPGAFSIGGDIGTKGGAGGGVSRPGTGLVLDFVASIAASSRSGGSGSQATISGEQFTSKTTQADEGINIKSTFETDGDSKIEIVFDEVSSSGDIYLKQVDETDLPAGAFSSASSTGNTMLVDGSEAETVGKVYDISLSSSFAYEGSLLLTLPYEEINGMTNSSLSEMNVRLMHFEEGAWEDVTVSVNTTANTVTGMLGSLSPVVAAMVEDGTFGDTYHENNPLSKISTANLSFVDQAGNVTIDGMPQQDIDGVTITLTNTQRMDQPVTVVTQILDENNVVVSISSTSEVLQRGQPTTLTVRPVFPDLQAGGYTVQVFVVDDMWATAAEMLAPALSKDLRVS